jgi:hypothetical protein
MRNGICFGHNRNKLTNISLTLKEHYIASNFLFGHHYGPKLNPLKF